MSQYPCPVEVGTGRPRTAAVASTGQRSAALLIDTALLLVVAIALSARGPGGGVIHGLLTGHLGVIAVLLGCPALLWALMATRGTSPGKHLLGIRVVRSDNGDAPGWNRALGRLLIQGVLTVVTVGLAGLSPHVDRTGRNRTWWDRAVGTEVVAGRMSETRQAMAYWSDAAVFGAGPAVSAGAGQAPAWTPVPPAAPGTKKTLHLRTTTVADPAAAVPDRLPVAVGEPASDVTVLTWLPPQVVPRSIRLQFDCHRMDTVDGSALIGRDPARTDLDGDSELVSLRDATRSVSKTHFKIERDHDGLWVTDRHSTNGVQIRLSDGARVTCEPGARTRLPAGAVVAFGKRTVRCLAVDALPPDH